MTSMFNKLYIVLPVVAFTLLVLSAPVISTNLTIDIATAHALGGNDGGSGGSGGSSGGDCCSGGGGSTPTPTPTPNPTPKPLPVCKSFTASPTTIDKGKSSALRWEVANATKININNGIGAVTSQGSKSVVPTVTTNYTLTAENADGKKVTCSAKVTVVQPAPAPVCNTFNASATTIVKGASTQLSWTTTNATIVSINQGIGSVPVDGSKSVAPTQTTTYTLTAKNADGDTVSCNRTITVTAAPKPAPVCNTFNASATTIVKGASTQLSWTTTNATIVSINQGIGSVPVDGSRSVNPTQTTTYTLTAQNADGAKVTCNRTITVTNTPTPTPVPKCDLFNITPSTITSGQEITISWNTTNATKVTLVTPLGNVTVDEDGSTKNSPTVSWTYKLIVDGVNGQKDTSCTKTVTVTPVSTPVPKCDLFTITPATITSGQEITIAWNTTNATKVTLETPLGPVTVDEDGSTKNSPTVSWTYKLIVEGVNGQKDTSCTKTVTVNPPAPNAPACVLYANPSRIDKGDTARLTWTSSNTSGDATINQAVGTVNPRDTNDYRTVSPLDTTTYTMTVTNSAGATATCATTITVDEEEEEIFTCENNVTGNGNKFYATDNSIDEGQSTTLIWETTGVTSLSINNGVNSNSLDGSETVSPNSDTTYTMTASNGSKTITCSVPIDVDEDNGGGGGGSSSPRCELKISDKSINKGDRITIEWETSNATFVELKDSTGKVLSTTDGKLSSDKKDYYDGEITLSPTKDTTYTLTAEKGSKDKECKVTVDVDDDIVVLENRDQQPLVTGISLTQVPYTGFEAGPFLTTLFYGLLLLWALYLAYVIVMRRDGGVAAFSGVTVEPTPMITSEKVNASMFAPATISTPRFVEPVAAASIATPVVGYAARDTVQDTIATEIENQAHAARVLFSSDALRTLIASTTDANRTETVKAVIAHAISSYPSEDGWVVVNEERMKVACATCVATVASAFTPSSVTAGNSSLAEAIVSGNIVAAYQMIGNRPMIALADAAADLDALYRIKQGGQANVSAYLASTTVDTAKLQAAIDALTGAIDGTYTDEAAAVKMAILKAVKAIA